jgi:hypothetical protein
MWHERAPLLGAVSPSGPTVRSNARAMRLIPVTSVIGEEKTIGFFRGNRSSINHPSDTHIAKPRSIAAKIAPTINPHLARFSPVARPMNTAGTVTDTSTPMAKTARYQSRGPVSLGRPNPGSQTPLPEHIRVQRGRRTLRVLVRGRSLRPET